MKTYLFYDIETSGLNSAFDQVLTFAGIRTGLDFKEIERHSVTIRLRKDIIPSPKAFSTHRLSFDDLCLGISEYEAALIIHKIINEPGTISVGYNSLGFDDVFLRFMFYRNLLDPYSHQYSNGCGRMDILPITTVYKLFHPECLKWPESDGKPSLKLDLIANENHFVTSGRAHEAMNDVESVIELSKILSKQEATWHYCLHLFDKTHEEKRINNIKNDFVIHGENFKICMMISSSFGSGVNYMAPVLHLGRSQPYKNQNLWLRIDSELFKNPGNDLNTEDIYVIRKRLGDEYIILPRFQRYWDKIPYISRQMADQNLSSIRSEWENFFDFVQTQINYKYPYIPDIDLDAALYQDGFFSDKEKRQCELFHKTAHMSKHTIINQLNSHRIKALALRILSRNSFDSPFEESNKEFESYMNMLRASSSEPKIKGYRGDSKFNRIQGLEELNQIEAALSCPDLCEKKMLIWLKEYISNF